MFKRLFMAFAAVLCIASAANAQAVGTYKAKKSEVVVEKVRKPHNGPFIGLNAGVTGTTGGIKALDFNLGFDFALAPSKRFAWGMFAGYETLKKINVGLLFIHGNYGEGGAFFWGIGYTFMMSYTKDMEYEGINYERRYYGGYRYILRFGYVTPSPLYFSLSIMYGNIKREDHYPNYNNGYPGNASLYSLSATIGYRFRTKARNADR